MKHTIDPNASWERLVASQPSPTRENFDALFAAGDRDAIILASLPLIKKHNKNTPAAIREDVELYALGEVTREVDRMLQHPNANPGSYLIDVVRHAIHEAKFGTGKEARRCVSTNRRLYRPRPKASDAERDTLVSRLQQQGHSPQMIEAECEAAGFDQSRIVETESQWPSDKVREDGHYTGEREIAEFGESDSSTMDDWETIFKLCDDKEIYLLELLAQGYTRAEAATELQINVSTITKWLRAIKDKVLQHQREHDRDM